MRTWWACTPRTRRSTCDETPNNPVPYTETKGSVLLHIVRELFQHLGQMELTRDALVASRRR